LEPVLDQQSASIMGKFHYKQELKRTIKLFGSFAVAFSFISISTGIFTNYGFVLQTSGPVGVWNFPIVTLGQLLIALVFMELAGRIPLSGFAYQWIASLGIPWLSWLTGWLSLAFQIIVVPTVDSALAPIIAGLFHLPQEQSTYMWIVFVTLLLQMLINVYGVKLASMINNAAVFTEAIGIMGLTLVLLVAAFVKPHASPSILFSSGAAESVGLLGFAMSFLMGAYTLVGWESAANLSEETIDAGKTVPKAIFSSLATAGGMGTLFLIFVTLNIGDLAAITKSANPIPDILTSVLGPTVATLFLVLVIISIFACGLVIMASGSRMLYALSRDDMFFANRVFKKVSSHGVPSAAIVFIAVLGAIAEYFADSLTLLVGATAVLPTLIYLATVAGYTSRRKRLQPAEGSFSLGKYAGVVSVAALLWCVGVIALLTIPSQFHTVTLWAGGILAVGIVLYLAFFREKMKAKVAEVSLIE
jgi:amino acid transporter